MDSSPRREALTSLAVLVAPFPVVLPLHLSGVPAEGPVAYGVYSFWLVATWYVLKWQGRTPSDLGLRRAGLLPSIGLASTLLIAVFLMGYFTASLSPAKPLGPAHLAKRALFCLVLSGPAQEVLFRGLLFTGFRKWKGPLAALLATSLLYALAHFRMGPAGMAVTFVHGLFYGAVVLKTGNLWGPLAVHGVYNFLFGYVLRSGAAVL